MPPRPAVITIKCVNMRACVSVCDVCVYVCDLWFERARVGSQSGGVDVVQSGKDVKPQAQLLIILKFSTVHLSYISDVPTPIG